MTGQNGGSHDLEEQLQLKTKGGVHRAGKSVTGGDREDKGRLLCRLRTVQEHPLDFRVAPMSAVS